MVSADVSMPDDVRRLGVTDRTGVAQHAASVVAATARVLDHSERFEAISATFPGARADRYNEALDWETVGDICRRLDVDALVSLDAFASDHWDEVKTEVVEITDEDGNDAKATVFLATLDVEVEMAWRVYHARRGIILDETRQWSDHAHFEVEADARSEAVAGLPAASVVISDLSIALAEAYGHRLSPRWIWVRRTWYPAGTPDLVEAAAFARDGDWGAALPIWTDQADASDASVSSRAWFNLAVYHELADQLDEARRCADQAVERDDNARHRDYASLLRRRLVDRARLLDQMSPVWDVE